MFMFRPQVRGGFSDRNGIKKINTIEQIDGFDERTRKSIINLFDVIDERLQFLSKAKEFYNYVYKNVFISTQDEIPSYYYGYKQAREPIYEGIISKWTYDEILTFLEEMIKWIIKSGIYFENLYDTFNSLFKTECVGYRFIDGIATRITSEEEVKTIDEALNSKYDACSKCIDKAINYLYDRENPDYENSVKESISAIEAICNIINETTNKTLGDALKAIEKSGKVTIHPAMKNAFNSLYGYTSDKSGIRHNSGIDEKTTYEEAKYMLVTCSAFLNYLIEIYEKSK